MGQCISCSISESPLRISFLTGQLTCFRDFPGCITRMTIRNVYTCEISLHMWNTNKHVDVFTHFYIFTHVRCLYTCRYLNMYKWDIFTHVKYCILKYLRYLYTCEISLRLWKILHVWDIFKIKKYSGPFTYQGPR